MNRPRLKAIVLLSLATLSASAFAQNANPAGPGTINYVEGSASIEGRPLTSSSVGLATLEAGQYLATANGKVEVLLTPGIFLRLGQDTTIQMVKPDLTHIEVKIERGQANIEVDQIFEQNRILIDQQRGQTQLLKRGLYVFDADAATVRVFDGEASVYPGSDYQSNVKPIKLKGGRELGLNSDNRFNPQKFDKDQPRDDLYKWSSLRSQYLGDASANPASDYSGSGYYNPGWLWAGGPYGYSWFPGAGFAGSSFGYGFSSPFYGGGPFYGGYGFGSGYYRGYGGGYYSGGLIQSPGRPGFNGGVSRGGGNAGGGFRGGVSASRGGSGDGSSRGGGGHR